MKEMFRNKSVWLVILSLLILIVAFNTFTESKLKKQRQLKQERLEKIVLEHNSTVSKNKSLKTENLQNTDLKQQVKKEDFIHNKDFGKSEAELDGDVKAEPYTGLLPEAPDMEENDATLLGIDSNNNGVRDDIEIEIVDRFGEDKNLVEAFFASNRSSQYAYSLAENDMLTEENIQRIMDNVNYDVGCSALYFRKSKYGSNHEDYYTVSKNIEYEEINTNKRKEIEKRIAHSFSGGGGDTNISEKSCQKYFEKTRGFEIIR